MTSLQDSDCLVPSLDTWGHRDHAATWMWTPRDRPASDAGSELNVWAARQVESLLAALGAFARLRSAALNGPAGTPPLAPPEHRWAGAAASPHQAFVREVLAAVREAPIPVTSIELTLDLFVWVRTSRDAQPVQGWVLGLARIDLQCETKNPYGALMMDHTLFRDGATAGDSNSLLHRLNQPLLSAALAAIESSLGPINHLEGLPDVYRGGFRSLDDLPGR